MSKCIQHSKLKWVKKKKKTKTKGTKIGWSQGEVRMQKCVSQSPMKEGLSSGSEFPCNQSKEESITSYDSHCVSKVKTHQSLREDV